MGNLLFHNSIYVYRYNKTDDLTYLRIQVMHYILFVVFHTLILLDFSMKVVQYCPIQTKRLNDIYYLEAFLFLQMDFIDTFVL